MPRISLDASQWFKGASTTNELSDGGFSPNSKPINLYSVPGVARPNSGVVSASSQFLANGVFGWATPPGAATTQYGLSSNASLDGTVYSMSASSIGSVSTVYGPDTGRDYAAGYSDLIYYKGSYFYTSKTDIAKDGDFDWWTSTLGLTALGNTNYHLLFVYGDILYITDGRYVHSWDGSAGVYNALDLPQDFRITAGTVFDDSIYLAADLFQDNSAGSRTGTARIYTWDGFSPSWISEEKIDEHISVLHPYGGTLFLATGTHFGYFNGKAVVPLRLLTSVVLKHQITTVRDVILIVQGSDILAYGNPIPGRQRFFSFPCQADSTIQGIHALLSTGVFSGSLGSTQVRFDLLGTGTTAANSPFESNKINLGEYSFIKKITVQLYNAVASGEAIDVTYTDSAGGSRTVGTIMNDSHNGLREVVFDVGNELATFTVQPKISFTQGGNTNGIRRFHVDYDFSEGRPSI